MSINFPPLPDSVASELVTVDANVQLRVLRAGSGPQLLFVPGWSFSGEVFVHQFIELSKTFEVLAVDPRGHGESSKPLTGNNFPQRGQDLAAVIDALELREVTLAGWSFGVLDVLSYLEQRGSERVAKLILIDEPPRVPFAPENGEEWGEAALTHEGLPAYIKFLSTDPAGFLAFIASDALGLTPEDADDEPAITRLIADGARTPEHIAIVTGAEGLSTDLSAPAHAFAATGKPILFFAQEAWASEADAWVTANLPSAEFARIPVHAGFLTEPAKFNERVASFMGSHGA